MARAASHWQRCAHVCNASANARACCVCVCVFSQSNYEKNRLMVYMALGTASKTLRCARGQSEKVRVLITEKRKADEEDWPHAKRD